MQFLKFYLILTHYFLFINYKCLVKNKYTLTQQFSECGPGTQMPQKTLLEGPWNQKYFQNHVKMSYAFSHSFLSVFSKIFQKPLDGWYHKIKLKSQYENTAAIHEVRHWRDLWNHSVLVSLLILFVFLKNML